MRLLRNVTDKPTPITPWRIARLVVLLVVTIAVVVWATAVKYHALDRHDNACPHGAQHCLVDK